MFATDGSEFSRAPASIAIALARRFGVTLDIATSVTSAADDEVAKARLAGTVRDAMVAGVDTEEFVRHGKHPVDAIVAAAGQADTNILVIGRRPPRGDLKEKLVGDIAMQFLQRAPCHVLVAGWQSTMWSRRILLICGGDEHDDLLIEVTAQLARATRTPVTVTAAPAQGDARDDLEADLAHATGLIRLEGVACDRRVADGASAQSFVSLARETEADLVVLANLRGSRLNRVVGGNLAEQLIGALTCPVLVVKPDAGDGTALPNRE
jgi:SulP family sulfate permease